MRLPRPVVRLLSHTLAWLVCSVYRLWCSTLRYTEINRETIERHTQNGQPVVLCLWHGELFPLIYLKRDLSFVVLVSQSDDGELIAAVLERMGVHTARGSSSRGGVKALLSAARYMQDDKVSVCMTVDGPRGPRHKVKEGAIFLAHHANAPIVPIRIVMDRAIRFKSWDRFQLPLPFSRVTLCCGDAYTVDIAERTPEHFAHACRTLEAELQALPKEEHA